MFRIALFAGIAAFALGGERTVAITMDDLPFAQSGVEACRWDSLIPATRRLLEPAREQKVPITAFVVGGNCPDLTAKERRTVLQAWREAGAELGNHTFSHISLHQTSIAEYERDILRADRQLRSLTGEPIRWFRSPYLHTGNTATAKARLDRFLASHGYRQAPVTFDNSDWLFAAVYADALARGKDELARRVRAEYVPYMESVVEFFERLSVEVTGREIPQVLLLHANRLNADMLGELLAMFGRRGYKFISLEQAMKDPVYRSKDTYTGNRGISWIRRWAAARGMEDRTEPEDPKWLSEAFAEMGRRR